MKLKIGIHAVAHDDTLEDLRRVWRMADSSGFHWLSTNDHFYSSSPWARGDNTGPCFEATAIMAAMAAETKNVRVGDLVLCMGYRNPAVLAKTAITIDHVSNGRLELGLGAGWHETEHAAYGIPFPPVRTRMEMLEEGIQIVKSMLTQQETTFIGKHFRVEQALSVPRPVQEKPRVWIGGSGERRTLRIAARYADGWNMGSDGGTVEDYRRKIQVLDGWCETEGRDPAEIERSVVVAFYMGTDAADARRKSRAFPDQWRCRNEIGGLFGTPGEVVDLIGAYVDAGAQGVNLELEAPYDWEALQAFVEEVMPAFS